MPNDIFPELERVEQKLAELLPQMGDPEMYTSYHHGEYYLSGIPPDLLRWP